MLCPQDSSTAHATAQHSHQYVVESSIAKVNSLCHGEQRTFHLGVDIGVTSKANHFQGHLATKQMDLGTGSGSLATLWFSCLCLMSNEPDVKFVLHHT